MIEKGYRFGEVTFKICSPDSMLEEPRMEAFLTDELESPDYTIEIRKPEPGKEPTEAVPVYVERDENHLTAYMNVDLLPKINEALVLCGVKADKLLPEKDHVMLHCSFIMHQGQAILFCAPSGVGKSTQAEFWKQAKNAEIVNEDRAVIGKVNGKYYAHGCWARGHGKTCKNVSVPVGGLILLGQGTENKVFNLHGVEALKRILPQCSFDEQSSEQCKKIIEIIADLLNTVTVFGFDCVNDISSVEELEKYL